MAGHPIVHVDFPTTDPEASSKFYSEAFGWQTEHNKEYNYWMFRAANGPGGGFVNSDSPIYVKDSPVVYIQVDDIDAALIKIEQAGGKTISKTDMGGGSGYALFTDPSGNRLGVYKS